jgi:hypothetical protein
VIHTDFQKGFIKAEVVSFDDLVEAGSMAEAKAKGKVRIEGKDYVMPTATWWSSASTSGGRVADRRAPGRVPLRRGTCQGPRRADLLDGGLARRLHRRP